MKDKSYVVECYRPDPRPGLIRACVPSAIAVSVGALCLALAFKGEFLAPELRDVIGALGSLLIVSGPIRAFAGLKTVLNDDRYLALRSDGLLLQEHHTQRMVPWDDIMTASWSDAEESLKIELRKGELETVPGHFVDISGHELAGRIIAIRRKALMNLLRPPNKPEC